MARRQGWRVDPTWIVSTPGVIPALNLLVRTLVSPGDKVLIQRPVYYPFFGAIRNNGGQIVSSALVLRDGRYEMDFDDFETQAADPATSLFILCSPHNPVGRVWTRQELARIGEICLRHGVVVLADEIHGDLIYRGVEFTPLAALGDEVADNAVICTAPSKTFNLAGLHTSNIIVPNAGLRTRFERTLNACGLGRWASPFGMLACEVAYREGEPWLNQALAYIEANLELLAGFVGDRMPGVQLIRPEGTYLVWLDFRELGLSPADLRRLMLEQSRVFPDEGSIFGPEGDGFERLNIACPRSILNEALTRIARAVEALGPPSPASTSPNETTP